MKCTTTSLLQHLQQHPTETSNALLAWLRTQPPHLSLHQLYRKADFAVLLRVAMLYARREDVCAILVALLRKACPKREHRTLRDATIKALCADDRLAAEHTMRQLREWEYKRSLKSTAGWDIGPPMAQLCICCLEWSVNPYNWRGVMLAGIAVEISAAVLYLFPAKRPSFRKTNQRFANFLRTQFTYNDLLTAVRTQRGIA